jgi:adenylate cyclase
MKYSSFIFICIFSLSCNHSSDHNRESGAKSGTNLSLNDKEKLEARTRFDSLMLLANGLQGLEKNSAKSIYLNEALSLAQRLNNDTLLARIYMALGRYFDGATEYYLMADYFYKALEFYQKIQDYGGAALALNNLSWGYIQANDFIKGIEKCRQGIELLNYIQNDDARFRAAGFLYNNLSIAFLECNMPDSALKYNELAYSSVPHLKKKILLLYSWIFTQFGCIYQLKMENSRAQDYFIQSVELRDSLFIADASVFAISKYCHFLNSLGRFREAIFFGRDGIKIAMKFSLNRYLIDIAGELRFSYEKLLSVDSAYIYAKMAMEFKDKVFNERKSIQLQSFSFNRDLKAKELQHEIENARAAENLKSERQLRNIFLVGFVFVMLFAGLFLYQRNKIKAGKVRSDELLLNILPGEVAEELKEKGSTEAKQFENVTVMFTDFKNFSQIAEKLSPRELVSEIDTCFKAFDHVIERYAIEKIKTIGDSYMCAGGLPVSNGTHAHDIVNAALEIQQFIHQHSEQRKSAGKELFEIRIGIHTGPVVAGIVGVKKFAYDIWGDTVNIASRMESSGEVGKVNISGTTYNFVKDYFSCTYRGKIQAKNKGEIDMYFVERSLSEV